MPWTLYPVISSNTLIGKISTTKRERPCSLAFINFKERRVKNFKLGTEIKVVTKDGKQYEGILMDIHRGYLSAVAGLGIILTFPVNSIINITKI